MKLLSLTIRQFRAFRETVTLQGLSPGLNIIAGDNEAGKSTLLLALQAAFFNRYNSRVAEQYLPFNASVAPKINISFQIDATTYTLAKVFSRKKGGGVHLSSNQGHQWEGPAAEDFLAKLMGFDYALRGGSRFEHQGLSGLLWLAQGRASAPVTLNEGSRQQLRTTFSTEMGEMLGGEQGHALYQRILEQRADYWDKRHKPRGHYRKAQQHLEQCTHTRDALQARLDDYEHKVRQLEERTTRLEAYKKDQTLAKAKTNLHALQKKADKIKKLETQWHEDTNRLQVRVAERKTQENQWQQRMHAIQAEEQARMALEKKQDIQRKRQEALKPTQAGTQALRDQWKQAKTRMTQQEQALRVARSRQELAEATEKKSRLEANLAEARRADAVRRESLVQKNTLKITAKQLDTLRTLERDKMLAEERLKAVATRLEYRMRPGVALLMDQETLEGEGSRLLLKTTRLHLTEMGEITLHPGGRDISALQREVEEHTERLQHALSKAGVATLPEAEEALRQKQALDGVAKTETHTVQVHAPKGLAALQDEVAQVSAKHQKVWHLLEGDTQPAPAIDPLEQALDAQKTAVLKLEEALDQREKQTNQQEKALIEAQADVKFCLQEAQTRHNALQTARAHQPDTLLQAAREKAQEREREQEQRVQATHRLLQAENPNLIAIEMEQAEKAWTMIRHDMTLLEREVRDLSIELNTLGQQGVAEALDKATGEHFQASRQLNHLEKQAHALDLLFKTLDEALHRAKAQVAQPIIDRMRPYLRQLFPASTPLIHENLELTGMERDGVVEPFTDLSIGTREQLAVLVRLAYADLLQEKGIPVLLILDDALVNSDDQRRDIMKKILYQAAKKCQILLLTCHGRAYRDTAGHFVALHACKTPLP